MADLEPIPYSDQQIRRILETVRTIAMVGASTNWNRPSYFVMKYLQGKGYRVIPVNPGNTGQSLLGETVYAALKDSPDTPPTRRRGWWPTRSRSAPRSCGCNWASATTRRRRPGRLRASK